MSVAYFYDSVAAFGGTVSGIVGGTINSYKLSEIPDAVDRGQLPCLLIVPEVGSEEGFRFLAHLGGGPAITVEFSHVMLVAESGTRRPMLAVPDVEAMLDNYKAAAKTQKFLDTVAGPPYNQVVIGFQVEQGIYNWAGVDYHANVFRHKYTIYE